MNWDPNTIPNGPSDIATFDASSTTLISISRQTTVDRVVFASGASAFTIKGTGMNLTFSGAGVINDSGVTQNFSSDTYSPGKLGLMSFNGTASAGDNSSFMARGDRYLAFIEFHNEATAATSTLSQKTELLRLAGSISTITRPQRMPR